VHAIARSIVGYVTQCHDLPSATGKRQHFRTDKRWLKCNLGLPIAMSSPCLPHNMSIANILSPTLRRPAEQVDRLMLVALVINLALAVGAAWGTGNFERLAWLAAGGTAVAAGLVALLRGTLWSSLIVALAMGLLVAVQLHATQGATGVHTNITLSLVLLLTYRDWRPIGLLSLAFAAHAGVAEPGISGGAWHVALLLVQGAVLCRVAQGLRRLEREALELEFLVNAMGRDGPIRLNLDVVRVETPAGKRLKDVQSRMASALQQVHEASLSVQRAAEQVASSSTELRGRTDQTAMGLQDSAMCLDQISIIVRHSSDASSEAKAMSATAAAAADEGGNLVSQVVRTMHEIETSSHKIHDIVGVIDSIAFQTNILALNAAVEAARAGEQGRGFAVVAAEVRSLAQRSAGAAKEIKSLIASSSATVERGTELVSGAGNTMNQLVGSVRRVGELFEGITADSDEHAQGLQMVTHSMQELSGITRQNVAVAEQSSEIANNLQQQAARLGEVLSAFRLSPGAASQASLAVAPPAHIQAPAAHTPPAATVAATTTGGAPEKSAAPGVVEFF
jgi:methyl-accepting chemotaxis protein